MECEKCGDVGYTEEEHGLIRRMCDCEAGRVLYQELAGGFDASNGPKSIDNETERIDSGTEPTNQGTGSGDTSQSRKPSKPKAKKKARGRAG